MDSVYNIFVLKELFQRFFGPHYPIEIIRSIIVITLHNYIIINVSDTQKLSDLFLYVYSKTRFSHILFNGLPYYQYTHPWRKYLSMKSRPSYDPDIICDYHHKLLVSCAPSIYPSETDTVKYVIKPYDDENEVPELVPIDCNRTFPPLYYDPKFADELVKYDSHKILLIGYTTMKIRNISGFNSDHRGSDHCQIFLKFYDKFVIHGPITLDKFIDVSYKIKSHKFDNWYEFFWGIYVTKNNNDLSVSVQFDHGP